MFVCMYVYMYVCIYVCMCACMYVLYVCAYLTLVARCTLEGILHTKCVVCAVVVFVDLIFHASADA